MRAYVLPDPRLMKLAGRFVWLDIDTEKPSNAPFVERFPIEAWPTLFVIDPRSEEVVLRWLGTATVEQVEGLLRDGERAVKAARAPAPAAPAAASADELLARADRLAYERKPAEAAKAYAGAVAKGGPRWAGRERAIESEVQSLGMTDDAVACAETARNRAGEVRSRATRARVAAQGLSCALAIEDAGRKKALAGALEPLVAKAVRGEGLLADDRTWLYDTLASAREEVGDEAGAKKVAAEWLAFLEKEAARAPSPLARSAFDAAMISAARRLGEVARVIPRIEASEKALPDEYVPPTNLAYAYLAVDRPADALAAADRALARAEGPRRIRVHVLRSEALVKLGKRDEARAVLEKALAEAEAMPEAIRPRSWMRRAEKGLKELAEPAAG